MVDVCRVLLLIGLSLSCALGCVGTSRANKLGVDLHAEVIYFCSAWHSAHVVLGMCGGFAVE